MGGSRFLGAGTPGSEKIKPLFWLGEFDELESPEYGKFLMPAIPGNGCTNLQIITKK
jgi:hypothetical protein